MLTSVKVRSSCAGRFARDILKVRPDLCLPTGVTGKRRSSTLPDYPKPPYRNQKQPVAGWTAKMDPRPDHRGQG